jgi:hypothetical protein
MPVFRVQPDIRELKEIKEFRDQLDILVPRVCRVLQDILESKVLLLMLQVPLAILDRKVPLLPLLVQQDILVYKALRAHRE